VLQNDPYNQNFGINFNFVVNYCSVSASRQGVSDPNCVSNTTEAFDYIEQTKVFHKFVRRFFNPLYYIANSTMEFIADSRVEASFTPVYSQTNFYSVTENAIVFFDNKYFDYSSFSFIPAPKMSFFVANWESFSTNGNKQLNPSYGLYSWAYSQNPKVLNI
jgi:hypothetical protein